MSVRGLSRWVAGFAFAIGSFGSVACGGGDSESATPTPATATDLPATATPGTGQTATAAPSAAATSTPGPSDPSGFTVSLEPVVSGFLRPTFVTSPPGDDRLFVLEKRGVIRIVRDGALVTTPFLDVEQLVQSRGNEQGLLGLAFHPGYAENGRFFIYYTAAGTGDNTIAEYRVSANADIADPLTDTILLAIPDFASNHNGGMLAFGPDGYLYIGTGDGGASGDPRQNGQNRAALLAKILRLDVDNVPEGEAYGIPPSNPFVGESDAAPEVWAYGLRNPWRFSFDRETGDLYIADVGQNKWEEINVQRADSPGGENYGWRLVEGPDCYLPAEDCDRTGLTDPVAFYDHGQGCSVTGGYVYRGENQPLLMGLYFYADYCSGTIWAMQAPSSEPVEVGEVSVRLTSFGEDATGELYALADNGTLFLVVATER